jgi:thiamine-phosphate diphosphorylase
LPLANEKPAVFYVTDRKGFVSGDPTAQLRGRILLAIQAGVDAVQVREKDLSARVVFDLVREVSAAARVARAEPSKITTRVIVNDRLDIALAAGASGVHLGHESAPAADAIRWCRAGNAPVGFTVGVSCHSREEARAAEAAGADYIFFGPIFETPSKRALGPPQGIPRLQEVSGAVHLPVIAIGGVNAANASDCLRAGAAGVAAIRLFQEASGLNELREIVERLHHAG